MNKDNRRSRRRQKKSIMRRRILLILFIVILIPVLFKGTSFLIDNGKSLFSGASNKEENNLKDPPAQPEFPIKEDKKETEKVEEPEKEKEPEEVKEPVIKSAKLLSVGDVMFHMPQIKGAYTGDGKYNFTHNFKYVKEHISGADIAIANFETVTAGNEKSFSGFPQFNSPKESLLALKETGFDILSTANNHSLDQGKDGILNTLKHIDEYGLKSTGTFKDRERKPLIEEKNDIKFGFLSYTYGLNGLDFYLSEDELSYMINLIDETKIKREIEELKEQVDLVVVSVHWGTEYQRQPNDSQVDLGHKMVDWGANIVLGSHPHVLQKSEMVEKDGKNNFIIYSMGNFISNQRQNTMGNSYTEDGIMVEIEVEKDITNDETTIKEVEFLPTWLDKYNENGKDIYTVLPTRDVLDGKLDININDAKRNRIQKSQDDSLETLKYD